jgi:hypothetical protein
MTPKGRIAIGSKIDSLGNLLVHSPFEIGCLRRRAHLYSRFDIEWLCQDEISFDLVQHLNQREDKEWSVTRLRDGNEICASSGREMLRMFSRAMGS